MVLPTSDTEYIFQRATFRTLETMLGVFVYTFILMFVWPSTNVSNLGNLIHKYNDNLKKNFDLLKAPVDDDFIKNIRLMDQEQWELIEQIENLNYAENIESHEVLRNKKRWLHYVYTAKEIQANLNNLAFYKENDLVTNKDHQEQIASINSIIEHLNDTELLEFPKINFDKKSAIANEFHHLRNLLLRLDTLKKSKETLKFEALHQEPKTLNYDAVIGSLVSAITVFLGFSIWIIVDPSGHSSWFQMAGTIILTVSQNQTSRLKTMFNPMIGSTIVALLIYFSNAPITFFLATRHHALHLNGPLTATFKAYHA